MKSKKKKQRRQIAPLEPSVRIPPFNVSIVFGKTVRYTVTTAISNSSITANDLAEMIFVANSATTGTSLIGRVEIRKIEMWGPASSGGALSSISAELSQNQSTSLGSRSILKADSSLSMTTMPYIKIKPRKNEVSGFNITGSATSTTVALLSFTLPVGSVLDLHVAITLIDQEITGQTVTVTSGLTAGTMYFKRLVGGSLVPQGWPAYVF